MSWQYRNSHRRSGGGGSYDHGSRSPGSFGAQGVCLFCNDLNDDREEHSRTQCPRFKSLKSQASRYPYIDTQLKVSDDAGYAAAGVLPFRRTGGAVGQGQHNEGVLEFLMAREYRDKSRDCGGDMLNFLGGKRLREKTKAIDCAITKVSQETGGQLSQGTMAHMKDGCPLVCWSSASKYVLFLYEFVGEDDCDVDVRCAGVQGTKRLEWVSREELLNPSWVRKQVHNFASEILDQLTSCRIMRQLEDLFDVAAALPSTVSGSSDQDRPSSPADLMKADLCQINKTRSHLDKNDDHDPGKNSDAVKELKDLLSRLSVEKS